MFIVTGYGVLFFQFKLVNYGKLQSEKKHSISQNTSSSILTGNVADILKSVSLSFVCASILYGFCHFGSRVSERFEDVGMAFYRLSWYLLPVEMRKKLSTTIAITQKRLYVRGSVPIYSMRELFLKVLL